MKLQAIPPKLRFVDNNGIALAGGKVYTYDGGTTTPKATYTDADGATPNANPVVLDSRGEAGIWLGDGMYKFVLKDSADNTIYTVDDLSNEPTLSTTTLSATSGSSLVGWAQSGTNPVARTVQEKLREFVPSTGDNSPLPTPTTPNAWRWDYLNADDSAQQRLLQSIPATVNMTGGAAVQGVGLLFVGDTSAQTPNSGFAETNNIRMLYTVNDDAGSKVQIHMINGLLILENDVSSTGNESAFVIGTVRATGPVGAGTAQGIWAGDLHVEKATGVAAGKMVGLEVGVHSAVTQSTATSDTRQNGIEVWSGDRSGITAVRAHNAIDVFGAAGWTNFLRVRHTDNSTEVCTLTKDGNLTVRTPSGNHSTLLTTNAATTTATLTVSGQTGASVAINAIMQADSGGQVTLGSSSNHHVVLIQNGSEVIRFISGFLYSSPSGVESTGAGSAALGANCPAVTVTAPYKWVKVRLSDGSTGYQPVWK